MSFKQINLSEEVYEWLVEDTKYQLNQAIASSEHLSHQLSLPVDHRVNELSEEDMTESLVRLNEQIGILTELMNELTPIQKPNFNG